LLGPCLTPRIGVLFGLEHSISSPCLFKSLIMGISPSLTSALKGYYFWWGNQKGSLRWIRTGTTVHAYYTVYTSVHTMRSTCSSIRGKQKYSPGGKRSWTPNLDRRSCPSRGVGASGTIKKEWQKWKSPQEQARGWVKYCCMGWSYKPVIFLEDLGLGEKE
jgi:hypothetical protein